jgi:hypothetical protein
MALDRRPAPASVRSGELRAGGARDDTARRGAMGRVAAEMVRTEYCADRIVPLYERAYERAIGL